MWTKNEYGYYTRSIEENLRPGDPELKPFENRDYIEFPGANDFDRDLLPGGTGEISPPKIGFFPGIEFNTTIIVDALDRDSSGVKFFVTIIPPPDISESDIYRAFPLTSGGRGAAEEVARLALGGETPLYPLFPEGDRETLEKIEEARARANKELRKIAKSELNETLDREDYESLTEERARKVATEFLEGFPLAPVERSLVLISVIEERYGIPEPEGL